MVKKQKYNFKISKIKISNVRVNFLNLVSLGIFFIYFLYWYKAVSSLGGINFSQSMEIYRNKMIFEGKNYIPTFINFLSKLCRAVAYVYLYIVLNNVISSKINNEKIKVKDYIYYIIGIVIYLPLSMMNGARFDLILFFIYAVMLGIIIYMKSQNTKLKFDKILKIIILFLVIAFIFSISRTFVGRTSKQNFIDYFTQYFGGSIKIYDVYMQKEHIYNGVFGQELFSGIRKVLFQLGVISNRNVSKDIGTFIYDDNGKAIGNVYTAFRNMYHDFGYVGVFIFQIILAIVYNIFYYKILYKEVKEKNKIINMSIIIYATISFCLYFHSYSEYFYCTILSFNYIVLFIMMYIVKYWLLKIKI